MGLSAFWELVRGAKTAGQMRCATCAHFCADPATLERELAGWATLGSAYGAVRGGDGLCDLHDRYLSPRSHCGQHSGVEGMRRRQRSLV